jgi:hypothetical protein
VEFRPLRYIIYMRERERKHMIVLVDLSQGLLVGGRGKENNGGEEY